MSSFARRAALYASTHDLVLVGQALGHRDLASTRRYTHVDGRAIGKAVDAMWAAVGCGKL